MRIPAASFFPHTRFWPPGRASAAAALAGTTFLISIFWAFLALSLAVGLARPASATAADAPVSADVNTNAANVAAPDAQMEPMSTVVLQSLDKVTAQTSRFEIPVGQAVQFGGSLYIKAQACRKAPPIEKPEAAAFLQIWEKKQDEQEATWVFSGWMFASDPALSYMDHPVYDVWVLDCKNDSANASDSADVEGAEPNELPQ